MPYSPADHAIYATSGSGEITGTIDVEWTCNTVLLVPATEYGRQVTHKEGALMDPHFAALIRKAPVEEHAFVFKDLPPGEYLVVSKLRTKKWISPEEIAQQYSVISLHALDPFGPLTVHTPNGKTLYRDSSGEWSHPGRWQYIGKKDIQLKELSAGQSRQVLVPLLFNR